MYGSRGHARQQAAQLFREGHGEHEDDENGNNDDEGDSYHQGTLYPRLAGISNPELMSAFQTRQCNPAHADSARQQIPTALLGVNEG